MKKKLLSKHFWVLMLGCFVCCSFLSGLIFGASVNIHYLGHSAFVLEFDNGTHIVTDYGYPNAWEAWGWDSPIRDIGELVPDVMTFSHTNHEDHYCQTRIPDGVAHILTNLDTLVINDIHIKPVRTCESNVTQESNSSFIFTYKDLKICHLGDAQAEIINIESDEICARIKAKLPDSLDLLLMTIEGQTQFIPQAEKFVDLLQPKRIIPIHHWSEAYCEEFQLHLLKQNLKGKNYNVNRIDGPLYTLTSEEQAEPVQIISLQREPFDYKTDTHIQENPINQFSLYQNYPNPFNPSTTIQYRLNEPSYAILKIFNIAGQEVGTLIEKYHNAGVFEVQWTPEGLPSGIYFYRLLTENHTVTRKLIYEK